ncbi:MAG TPA: heavy metal sensor histidine kinase [Candidatus Acidoferrum sp.]|jgi:heavy metal sensor kinase
MKPLTVRARLTLFYAVMLTVVLAFFGALFYKALGLVLERRLTAELKDRALFLANHEHVDDGGVQVVFNPNDREEAYLVHSATRYYQVFQLPSGTLVVQSQELELLGVRLSPEAVRSLANDQEYSDMQLEKERLRFHNDIVARDNSNRYLVRVGIPLTPADQAQRGFLRSLLFLTPLGILLASLAGWEMSRRALRPMKSLAVAARHIDIKQLQERLPTRGAGDEVDEVAQAFNETLARLENSVGQMKQFTASISHELRTPLTALRGEAEIALLQSRSVDEYKRVLASQLEEFDKLAHMINQLLVLANAEAGEIQWTDQRVDLSALVDSLVDQLEPVSAAKKIDLNTISQPHVHVRGDASWIERVILNLLDNAIKFTPEGGTVSVSVIAAGKEAELCVRDTGIGISPQALPHIFDRFYRAEPSRSKQVEGVGLGLALVRWIVEKHGGQIAVQSEPAKGSRFTVLLPLDDPNL